MVTDARERMPSDPRSAIREREILCLVCGRALRQLTNTHLREAGFREAGAHPRTKPVDLPLLRALRLAGLSLRQIGRRLGVPPVTISARLRFLCLGACDRPQAVSQGAIGSCAAHPGRVG